jgi:hypothetical protein
VAGCYRTVQAEGLQLLIADKALAITAAAPATLPTAILQSEAAYCDPDRSHIQSNAEILRRAVETITKERGNNAPRTKDVIRRLERLVGPNGSSPPKPVFDLNRQNPGNIPEFHQVIGLH